MLKHLVKKRGVPQCQGSRDNKKQEALPDVFDTCVSVLVSVHRHNALGNCLYNNQSDRITNVGIKGPTDAKDRAIK